jgi:hypothetical protein
MRHHLQTEPRVAERIEEVSHLPLAAEPARDDPGAATDLLADGAGLGGLVAEGGLVDDGAVALLDGLHCLRDVTDDVGTQEIVERLPHGIEAPGGAENGVKVALALAQEALVVPIGGASLIDVGVDVGAIVAGIAGGQSHVGIGEISDDVAHGVGVVDGRCVGED